MRNSPEGADEKIDSQFFVGVNPDIEYERFSFLGKGS